jgi:hypothetical protein
MLETHPTPLSERGTRWGPRGQLYIHVTIIIFAVLRLAWAAVSAARTNFSNSPSASASIEGLAARLPRTAVLPNRTQRRSKSLSCQIRQPRRLPTSLLPSRLESPTHPAQLFPTSSAQPPCRKTVQHSATSVKVSYQNGL